MRARDFFRFGTATSNLLGHPRGRGEIALLWDFTPLPRGAPLCLANRIGDADVRSASEILSVAELLAQLT
ncbi:hypothetical protein F4561_004389 [Lipingzhangella halophila]|uniref:Uncharacterized protein n=1 Tax=Lipingzhangella halophila TaxID=1783352 RepID=A0A7W7W573_9ACTN|nr:hypothetical protein [Lipingzhangella halophila]